MRTIICILIGLCSLSALANETGRTAYIRSSYLGGLITRPGLGLGFSASFAENWRYGIQAGAYYHPRTQTGTFISPNIEWIKTSPKGFQYGFGLDAGYLRTFIPRTVEVTASGTVKKPFEAGTNHFMMMPSVRLGKDLEPKNGVPVEWFVSNNLMLQYPYFEGINFYHLLAIGINYKLQ